MALGSIPNDIRNPLVYVDIDNSNATSGSTQAHKILVLGIQGATATATALAATRIGTSDSEIDQLYGKGSMLARMLKMLRKANNYTDVYAMGLADLEATAATATLTFTADSASGGVIALLIDGESLQVTVADGDDGSAIATAVADEINVDLNLPVTAVAAEGVVTLTSKWTGVSSNDLDVRVNYYDGEVLPTGVTLDIVAFADGAGTPDMSEVIASMPDEWFNHIVMPFSDTQSLNTLNDELVERWGPLKMVEAIAYTAYRGTWAETGSFGSGRNDYLVTCMGTNQAPQAPYLWAASYAGIAAYNLAIDPARPLQTLELPSILPPSKDITWDSTERNLLLHDGIATYTVSTGGSVLIEREISTYQTNAYGDTDVSYLDITTPATLGYLRYSLKQMVTNRYPRHKLAGDDVLDLINPGQPIVTPKLMRNSILELCQTDWVPNGLVEDFEGFNETLTVERDDSDMNRLNCVFKPDLVNQLRIFAALNQFKL